jgi:hypothetical protein
LLSGELSLARVDKMRDRAARTPRLCAVVVDLAAGVELGTLVALPGAGETLLMAGAELPVGGAGVAP